jgi:uncharacterized protein
MQWLPLFSVMIYLLTLIVWANQLDRRRGASTQRHQFTLSYPYGLPIDIAPPPAPKASPAGGGNGGVLLTLLLFSALSVLLMSGAGALFAALAPEAALEADAPQVSLDTAVMVAGLALLAAGIGAAVTLSRRVRVWFAGRVGGTFDPDSHVHKAALVLALLGLVYTLTELLLAGGVAGLAEDLQAQSPGAFDAVANLALMVLVAFFGVGITTRRSLHQVFARLDLRLPTMGDWLWGIATAFLCLVLVFVFSLVLMLVFSPEALEQQGAASQEIARALSGSLGIVFLAAFTAAVGEEILFRGALQPVFGLVLTTLFFALLHSQYAFTPGSAAILIVGGAFGVLKQRQSTTAAIIAHFAYNFALLGLSYMYIQFEEAGLLPEAGLFLLYLIGLIGAV